ncbi:MAG: FHA domain-containing protein [Lachnospiraceae bacterium]|nr:FHA domain-containing protein [Lachnospiraceae bacterium]
MISLNKRKIDGKQCAEHKILADDKVDDLTFGMLSNNDIEGLAKTTLVEDEIDRYFIFDIADRVTMKEYLGDSVKEEHLLKAFYGIAVAIKTGMEYMINWTSYILDEENIYIDSETGDVKVICMPLLTMMNDGNTCKFFKNILFTAQFDEEEDGEYVGKLMVLLNPKSFSIDKFIEEIEDLLEIEHKKFDDYTIEDVEVPEVVSAEAKAEEVKEETEAKAEEVKEETEAKAEEVKEETEAKAEEVKEEAKAKTEDISEDIEFVENNEAEKIEVVEEKPEEKKEETKKGGFLKFFTQPIGQKKENKPYLQKTKTNEKLYIEKDKFVIGSEDGSDYQIKEETVEAQHAFIVKEKNEFFLVDNESKTGTFMNTAQLLPNEKYVLVQGAHIRIAEEEFDFKLHD